MRPAGRNGSNYEPPMRTVPQTTSAMTRTKPSAECEADFDFVSANVGMPNSGDALSLNSHCLIRPRHVATAARGGRRARTRVVAFTLASVKTFRGVVSGTRDRSDRLTSLNPLFAHLNFADVSQKDAG